MCKTDIEIVFIILLLSEKLNEEEKIWAYIIGNKIK